MKYIGIDLAWTYKNETGICVINKKQEIEYLEAKTYTDEEIINIVESFSTSIVSIDSPLVVKNETGGRAVDSMLMKQVISGRYLKLYATSRSYMLKTFGQIRGEDIYKALSKDNKHILGENIIETFPTGIFLSLFPEIFEKRYKISSKLPLDDLKSNAQLVIGKIIELGFTGIRIDLKEVNTKKEYKMYEDMIDALLCSINSYYFYQKKSLIFKCDDNGVTVLPEHEQIVS